MQHWQSILQRDAEEWGISLDAVQMDRFDRYLTLLLDWNTRMNLTAIKQPEEVAVRHFADSLTLLGSLDIPEGGKLIDVGTGAGFPGVPAKIMRPDIDLTLLDSLQKRLNFLGELLHALGLDAHRLHARAEEGGRSAELREQFDVATARAVASLPALCEYCLPFVKVGGVFAAMKGPGASEELEQSRNALEMLGGQVERLKEFRLSDGSTRVVMVIKKISHTPPKYPRMGTKIAKSPL